MPTYRWITAAQENEQKIMAAWAIVVGLFFSFTGFDEIYSLGFFLCPIVVGFNSCFSSNTLAHMSKQTVAPEGKSRKSQARRSLVIISVGATCAK